MRSLIIAISLSLLPIQFAWGAGFLGPGSPAPVSRAVEALDAPDDAPCVLDGRLLSRLAGRKNRYLFEDASGQIVVKIKKKVFGDNIVTPRNRVRIEGEVEVSDKYPNEVEVDRLLVLE